MIHRLIRLGTTFLGVLLVVGSLGACAGEDLCGNGKRDAGEDCDDANSNENDGCFYDCTLDRSMGEWCHPIPNRPNPKYAGRTLCRPTEKQPCVLCATVGGGITGENATWDSCYPIPNPPNPALGGFPNCTPSFWQRCIPCSGSREVPGQSSARLGSLVKAGSVCGDGKVTLPEVCDPEAPGLTDAQREECRRIACRIPVD